MPEGPRNSLEVQEFLTNLSVTPLPGGLGASKVIRASPDKKLPNEKNVESDNEV